MPTTTFYNLPQEKKNMIFNAARNEFARVAFKEASINKIIQAAEIPRGSFYMYFRNKKDLAYYILTEYATKMADKMRETLKNTSGDIFAVFVELFDSTFEYSSIVKQEMATLKNLFISMHSNGLHPSDDIDMQELFELKEKIQGHVEIMKVIDLKMLKIESAEDLDALLGILFTITKQSITHALVHIHDIPSERTRFIKKIDMIKHGVLKDKS